MPTVWRPVVIPGRTSCEALHYVTQDAMGRQPYHLLKFSSSDDPTHCTDSLGEHG
ncbi:MAG TPA: plasmid pRiA4b ORF-3 family protein [Firmicutes bacterium]|nr:plasmid pRiA4b ORF-3 family protein [Bacillota bacterium]